MKIKKAIGIQKGTQAGSKESKELDGNVKVIAEAISKVQTCYFYEAGHTNMISERYSDKVKQGASLPELVSKGITLGCVPDGGMWFTGDRSQPQRRLVVCFEGKYQKDQGNAWERWFKNAGICKLINPDVKYITFMSGTAALPGGCLDVLRQNIPIMNSTNFHTYCQPEGFTQEEIFSIMISHLNLDLTFDDIKPFLPYTNCFNTIFAQ